MILENMKECIGEGGKITFKVSAQPFLYSLSSFSSKILHATLYDADVLMPSAQSSESFNSQ